MIKNIAMTIGALCASTSIYAAYPSNKTQAPLGINLQAPTSVSSWSFGIEALYLTPMNSTFQYAQTSDQSTPTDIHKNESVDPESSWGSEFDATYHFAGNSRDMEIALAHFDVDSSDSETIQSGRMTDPFGLTNRNTDTAEADMDDSIDAIDVVFGQTFKIGQAVTMRPFGGIRYADLESNNVARYFNSQSATPDQGNGRINSEFVGVGPRAGLDATYFVGSHISFVGTVGASLLIGNIDTKVTTTAYSNNPTITDNDEARTSVPELDAKLGINYRYAMSQTNALNIQLGYQVVDYFDVMNKDYLDASTTINTTNNTDSLGYHGPYVRAQLDIV